MYSALSLQLANENVQAVPSVIILPTFLFSAYSLSALHWPVEGQAVFRATLRGAASVSKGQMLRSYASISFQSIPFQNVIHVYLFNMDYYS
jgi:cephalosporin-C deacetylase-like acetyl esterase